MYLLWKICKKICKICKICRQCRKYAKYALPTLLMPPKLRNRQLADGRGLLLSTDHHGISRAVTELELELEPGRGFRSSSSARLPQRRRRLRVRRVTGTRPGLRLGSPGPFRTRTGGPGPPVRGGPGLRARQLMWQSRSRVGSGRGAGPQFNGLAAPGDPGLCHRVAEPQYSLDVVRSSKCFSSIRRLEHCRGPLPARGSRVHQSRGAANCRPKTNTLFYVTDLAEVDPAINRSIDREFVLDPVLIRTVNNI